mgnify:CR=1 FL=1
MSLTLDVFEIARTRQTVEGTLELDEMPELAHFIQALEGSLKFSVTGLGIVERLPAASLSFEGTVVMQCARCNEPVSVPVSRELVFRFTKTEAEANALPLDEEGDDEEVIVGSRSLSCRFPPCRFTTTARWTMKTRATRWSRLKSPIPSPLSPRSSTEPEHHAL